MFENLTDKLQRTFKNLRGQGKLTEENINEALREIRLALLEADVNFKVVKELIDHIREKALGPGGDDLAIAGRTGGQDRPRRTGRNPRRKKRPSSVRLAAALRHADGRAAGFRQNHHLGQAGALAKKDGHRPHAGFGSTSIARRPASS